MKKRAQSVQPKIKKAPPHAFVLDELAPLSPVTRPMFSCLAVYVGPKIVLCLRDGRDGGVDDGVWLATSQEHHASLQQEFPNMRSIKVLGKPVTGWQLLPVDAADFESSALQACEMIAAGDVRIGKIPKAKSRSKKSREYISKSPNRSSLKHPSGR